MGAFLSRDDTALCLVDTQDKLFPLVERPDEVAHAMQKTIRGFQALDLPIVSCEQYPKGLGRTIAYLRKELPEEQDFWEKTTFSCAADGTIRTKLLSVPVSTWVLIGIEAHICVLQSAKDLLELGKQVVVLSDAVSSRSGLDLLSALGELTQAGARVSTVETILFELCRDAMAPGFKVISELCKRGG